MGRAALLRPTLLAISLVSTLVFVHLCAKWGQGTDLPESSSYLPLYPSPPSWVSSAGSNP